MKRLKKVICCLLMFAILFSTWGMTEVQAADDVSVSGATYPDWIKKGGAFVLKGTVKSNSTITELTASLNDGHNNVMYSKTVRPNSTQYNLSGIDAAMRFDLLSANPYTYQVKVRNSSGLHTVIMKPFTVYSGSKPSFATGLDTSAKYRLCVQEDSSMVADIAGRASGSNALVKKDNGQSTANWYLEYAGSSAYMIKNADTGLYLDVANGGYRNGTNVQIWTKNSTEAQCWYFIPDGGSYKIISKKNYLTLSLENSLALNKPSLDMWRDLGVAHQRFILKKTGGSTSASTLRISGANTIPTLTEGQAYSLKGTITSNYNITKVQAVIYNNYGTSVVQKAIYPNSTSASLTGAIDKAITFNKLSAGTYRYCVWAEDASGCRITLIWQQFEVKAASKKSKTLSVNWTNIKKRKSGWPKEWKIF